MRKFGGGFGGECGWGWRGVAVVEVEVDVVVGPFFDNWHSLLMRVLY
jgi:hypothetical protein